MARPRSRPRRTTARSRAARSARCAAPSFTALELAALFLVAVPLPIVAYSFWDQYATAAGIGVGVSALSLLGISAALFFGSIVAALVSVYVIPRLCMLFLKPGVTYPAFGFHYLMQSIILRTSNSEFFCVLFGDSTFITTWMSKVGWNLNKVEQTGSNMGTNQRHDNPFLCNIGSGTMVSDGLSMINTHMSATSFQLAEAKIGENNYLGNDIFYPPNGKTGTNVLLGTKTMIPIDGEVRENVGLLGSPAFEIPRMVDRDRDMNASFDEETRRARLRQKNRYNLVTALIFLAARWMSFFAALVLWTAALAYYDRFGVLALFAATVAITGASIVMFVLLERASLAFKRLEPKIASIYDPYFWFHERHWKLSESPITRLFSGTPFRTMMFRAMGMKIGAKVFDCGRSITERTLTEVGDYANLNEGCVLQAHSLEEGVFKSDHIRIGNGCSIGPGAFVHYGVTMGDHVVLDADSFLMKGEVLDSHTGWRGNPAKLVRRSAGETADACEYQHRGGVGGPRFAWADLVSRAANGPSLQQALDAVAVPGLLIGHRVISPGDEGALRDAEAASISSSIANVRRASGAARMVARSLLAQLGHPEAQVPKGAGGAPVWPVGVVGSLAHDDEIAVAAVGLRRDFASVGIDVERAGALAC